LMAFARAKALTICHRGPANSCSARTAVGGPGTVSWRYVQISPPHSISGTTTASAPKSLPTLQAPSATSATSFSAIQQPEARDSATPSSPNSTISSLDRGARTGRPYAASAGSLADGTVDDLAPGSSPARTRTPPRAFAPNRLPLRNASPARSMPGDFPYQTPTVPSYGERRPGTGSCDPQTAVAASSSFSAGTSAKSGRSRRSGIDPRARSRPPRGLPGYPETNLAVRRPLLLSRSCCSTRSRAIAEIPPRRTGAPVGRKRSARSYRLVAASTTALLSSP
jgi:hypothetical protein